MSAQPDPRSTRAAEYRKFYKTARWERLRRTQLGANPLCRYCYEREDIVEATVVDHIKKHDGDTTLFWDPCNLQSLCKPCHDRQHKHNNMSQWASTKVDPVSYAAVLWPRHGLERLK